MHCPDAVADTVTHRIAHSGHKSADANADARAHGCAVLPLHIHRAHRCPIARADDAISNCLADFFTSAVTAVRLP
jgi:hypothetical protein